MEAVWCCKTSRYEKSFWLHFAVPGFEDVGNDPVAGVNQTDASSKQLMFLACDLQSPTESVKVGMFIFQKPDKDAWGSGLEAIETALDLEKHVNQALLDLHKVADKHADSQVPFLALSRFKFSSRCLPLLYFAGINQGTRKPTACYVILESKMACVFVAQKTFCSCYGFDFFSYKCAPMLSRYVMVSAVHTMAGARLHWIGSQ